MQLGSPCFLVPVRFYPLALMPMTFSRAIGLGIGIIVLKLLLPEVLSALEQTALAFLNGALVSANVATQLAGSAASVQISNEPFELPRVQGIRQ